MKKLTTTQRQALNGMKTRLKGLQSELIAAKKREGIDDYLSARITGTKLHFTRTKVESGADKAVGEFRIVLELTTKRAPISIPLSIASGKTVAGFMYQIDGTGESSVASASVSIRTRGLIDNQRRHTTVRDPAGREEERARTCSRSARQSRSPVPDSPQPHQLQAQLQPTPATSST
jgi:hypothetical protein